MISPEPSESTTDSNAKLIRVTLGTIVAIATFWLLSVGRTFLVPLVLAVFVWFLIESLNGFWRRVSFFGKPITRTIAGLLSAVVVFFLVYALLTLIASNVALMTEAAPDYQKRLIALYEGAIDKIGIDKRQLSDDLVQRFDLGEIVGKISGALTGIIGNGVLIAMYVVFLILEGHHFGSKLNALIPSEAKRQAFCKTLALIGRQVKVYLLVKTFVSLLTAVGAYLVMRFMKLDFCEFWAVLIFVLNFIPYVGSTIASILPVVFSLAQLGSWTETVILFVAIQAVQMSVGYFLEPTLMGKSLNISPLAVMLALTFWSLFWGISGMFLSVPITVIIMIVCSQFESSRWIAVFLSKDGDLRPTDGPRRT